MKIIRLRTIAKDRATGLTGMVTHVQIGLDKTVRLYCFQPRGLNPENGHPIASMWLNPLRLEVKEEDMTDVDFPMNVLGMEVTDLASGFTGTAINMVLHTNGCIHVEVQPTGILPKTGTAIESVDFDIRRLKGPAIKILTEEQQEESERKYPSPSPTPSCLPRLP